ncbi:protein Aster-B-like [Hetaerina americana]|uniref:protein Aster-B-like n=1 Tax=Hetaerina americana TaxID=62018 RepID=UPI003A7F1D85
MDTQEHGMAYAVSREERNEEFKGIIDDTQGNSVNEGNALDHTHNRSSHTVKQGTSKEEGIHNPKGGCNHIPLCSATLRKDLSKEDSKASGSKTKLGVKTAPTGNKTPCICTSSHDARQVVDLDLNMHIDQLFSMLFTQSSFYLDFQSKRRTLDIAATPWEEDPETGGKKKKVELIISPIKVFGAKTIGISENYIMLPCSKPGQLYSIDMRAYNSGFHNAEAFHYFNHFCLRDTTQEPESKENDMNGENINSHPNRDPQISSGSLKFTCHFSVFSKIVFTKSLWAPVKTLLSKASWFGVEEYFGYLTSKLKEECDHGNIRAYITTDDTGGHKIHRRRKHTIEGPGIADAVAPNIDHTLRSSKISKGRKKKKEKLKEQKVPWMLLLITIASFALFNAFLYFKLRALQEIETKTDMHSSVISLDSLKFNPGGYKEWLSMPFNVGGFNDVEMEIWRTSLDKVMDLLDEVGNLQ